MNLEERVMGKLADLVIRFKWLVLGAGLLLFILSILAAGNIKVKTEIKDMMPEENPKIQSYLEIDELFSGGSNVIITVEGNDKKQLATSADKLVTLIRENQEVMAITKAINLKLDRGFIDDWGLLLQKEEDLERTLAQFDQLNLLPFLSSMNDAFEETYTGEGAEDEMSNSRQEIEAVAMLDQFDEFFSLLAAFLESPDTIPVEEQAGILADTFLYGSEYQFSPDNTMLMFTLIPDFGPVDYDEALFMMAELASMKEEVERGFPGVTLGFTGDIPIQVDEQYALSFDLMTPALVALVLILILFIFSFEQFRSIVLILLSLVIGIVFNYGFLGITIKEINMLTSIMGVLLVGLGVDYGIQIVTNFNSYRDEGLDPAVALRKTYTHAGLGIFLAALTTAIAFFVMAITGSRAFAQFGVVLGTGILQCFLAMFLILPSLLLVFGKKDLNRRHLPTIDYGFLAVLGRKMHEHRKLTIAGSLVVTVVLLVIGFTANRMDYDLMAMEPQDMPSIIQYEKIMDKYEITPFQAMVTADSVEEARELTSALEDLQLVGDITSVSDFLPPPAEQQARLELIRRIREMPARYATIVYDGAKVEDLLYEVQRFEWNIIEMGDLSVAGLGEGNKIVRKRDELVREVLGAETGKPGKEIFQNLIALVESDPALYGQRLTALDAHYAPAMDRIVARMAKPDRIMTVDDLPESIVNSYFDDAGEHNLVTIYPRSGVWKDLESMERFNEALFRISPRITGMTQIFTAWLDEATVSSIKAGIYITLSVIVFLLVSLRSIRYTLLAASPLIIGMIWMLGVYPLLGMKLNIMNIIMIPLVIGMGIDFGIHLVHRFQVEQDIDAVYRYTGKAVFLSAMTTMIGFGSLGLIGKFPSIASMGAILFIGITCCLLAALVVLPALLHFNGNGNGKGNGKGVVQ
jgi:predicted RND superfamily exporter protein